MSEYNTTTLANGLRIVTVPMPHLHSAELVLYLGVGGRHEQRREVVRPIPVHGRLELHDDPSAPAVEGGDVLGPPDRQDRAGRGRRPFWPAWPSSWLPSW